jgi:hypothetical protein
VALIGTLHQALYQSNKDPLRLVLKVSGHYFDHRKIENELGSLLLLHEYCPNIPVPKVFAWSRDGKSIETADGASKYSADLEGVPHSKHAWILINRLPGRSMTVQDLDGPDREQILYQVAEYVNMWRTLVPSASYFGNLKLLRRNESPESTNVFSSLMRDKLFCIGDLLLCTYQQSDAMASPLDYYSRYARDQVKRLTENHLFRGIKDEVWPIVEDFLSVLPYIPVLQVQKPAKFTQFDLSPRNILISENGSSRITGFLDFEFAGFFPEEEEFINEQVRQSSDWRIEDWEVLMINLSSLGQKVPPIEGLGKEHCIDEQHWKQLETLVQTIDSITPWHIQEGAFSDQDLATELKEASVNMQEKMRELQELLNLKRH